MTTLTLAELKGTIDFGIITIRQDEYEAILSKFPGENNIEGERNYRISDVLTEEPGAFIRVAIVRCTKQGQAEAQSVANDMLNELSPECLLAVGIAGGIRDNEFSLGDVVVATHIHDFSVEAVRKDGTRALDLSGGDIPKSLQTFLVSLKSYEQKFGDWGSDVLLSQLPPVNYEDPSNYYGPKEWRREVQMSLEKHFGVNVKRRHPKVVDGPVASSDRLIKNVEITEQLLSAVRSTKAVEMEVAGVYHATRRGKKKDYQFTTIRGISDIIGFDRDDGWTKYACQSAAAFTYAFVKSGLLIAPKKIGKKEVSGANLSKLQNIPDTSEKPAPKPITRQMSTGFSKNSASGSLLTSKLESLGAGSLANVLEKDKWHIITETVNEMYRFLYRPFKDFTPRVFETFEMDLVIISEAIADSSKRYEGQEQILKYLGICRRKASLASEYYTSKDSAQRDAGHAAVMDLQTNLKNTLDYIEPIYVRMTDKYL